MHDVPEANFTLEVVVGSGLNAGRSSVAKLGLRDFMHPKCHRRSGSVPMKSPIVNDRFTLPIAKIYNFSEDIT